MNNPTLSRRDLLKLTRTVLLTLSGLVGLGGLMRFLSYPSQPPAPTEFDLGPASNYSLGSRTLLLDVPAVLIRGDQGFIALNLVYPHLACRFEDQSEDLACPFHGSRFELQGKVTHGPVAKPLPQLRLESMPDGKLHLYTE